MSNKMYVVLKHEFLLKVKSKGYVIMTFLGPLLLSLLFVIPAAVMTVDTGDKRIIAIVDETERLAPYFEAAKHPSTKPLDVQSTAEGIADGSSRTVHTLDADLELQLLPKGVSQDSLKSLVQSGQLTALLSIPSGALADSNAQRATLRMRNTNDFSTVNEVEKIYEEGLRNERLKAKGVDPAILEDVDQLANLQTVKVTEQGESEDKGGTFAAGYITGFLMYMTLLIYGSMILRSVVEEKSTRVIEVMVSSVKPFDLLLGKVLGLTGAALIQMTVWSAMLALLATIGVSAAETMTKSSLGIHVPPELFIYFIVYFVLGFLIYATLYAAIGATADQESDTQQASLPVTLLVVIPILLLTSVIQTPSSTLSTVLSMVPFFAPILMMGRVFSETPPFWQLALSIGLLIATFFGVLWLAARIYRVGILMYGKRFSPKEFVRWLRYS